MTFRKLTSFKQALSTSPAGVLLILMALSLSACNTVQGQQEPVSLSLKEATSATDAKRAAEHYFDSGDYEQAAKSYFTALSQRSTDNEARLGLAESYFRLGYHDKALPHYKKLSTVAGYSIRANQGVGLVKLQSGDPAGAEALLKTVTEEDPTLWRSWNGLAQIYDQQQEWGQAANAYSQALQYTDMPEFIYNNMGVSFMAQEHFEHAALAFKEALNHKPTLHVAKTNYKLALAMQDRYDESVIEHNVYDEAKALNNAGYAAMLRADYAAAERLFLKSIDTNPSFYEPPYRNLQVLYHLKRKQT